MEGNNNGYKRAVLYARVSYDDRDSDGRNLAGQLEMAREYARRKGYEIVAEIQEDDRGASGAAFELEGLTRVLEMAEADSFDVLIPREIDRLSRNLAKQLIVEEELKRAGVGIEYALGEYPDTPEGNLQKNIKASVAEYERLKIAERTVRGKRSKIKGGNVVVCKRPPLGYRQVEADGKRELVIYEPEARIVRLIFRWYTEGDGDGGPLTLRAIAHRLTDTSIPTYADIHGGRKKREPCYWCVATVSQMLRNETYAGVWSWGKKCRNDKRRWVRNGADHLLRVEVPAIVDRQTWEAAQERLAENRQAGRHIGKYDYLLSGRATCGTCGLKTAGSCHDARGRHYQYYRCPSSTFFAGHGNPHPTPYFRADLVDAAVWEWVRGFLTDPAALERGLGQYRAEREKENTPIREHLQVVEDLLADNRRQLDRLLDLYLSGDFPKEVLTERRARLETTISALDRERAGLAAQLEARILTPDQVQSLKDFAARVGRGLDLADTDFETRRRIIEDLDVRAILCVEDGQKVVRVSCIVGKAVCAWRIPQVEI
jgi:site-specific DNA recombinase